MIEQKTIALTEDELNYFVSILTERTGIVPRSSHVEGIKNFLCSNIKMLCLATRLSWKILSIKVQ